MTDQTLDLDAIDARHATVAKAIERYPDTLPYAGLEAHADRAALTAEVRKLREAAATALGNLDDPTGGEHVADMRAAAAVLREALKAPQS